MPRTIFRIDDRLIHGQVVEGWVHGLSLTRITIVSDRVKADENYKRILEFSVPSDINVDTFGIREMAEKNDEGYFSMEDTIVLFESPGDVLGLLDHGVVIEEIHVGCLHYNGTNYQVRSSIAVSEDNINDLLDINSMGTKIECQSLPQDKKIDMLELIKKYL